MSWKRRNVKLVDHKPPEFAKCQRTTCMNVATHSVAGVVPHEDLWLCNNCAKQTVAKHKAKR